MYFRLFLVTENMLKTNKIGDDFHVCILRYLNKIKLKKKEH